MKEPTKHIIIIDDDPMVRRMLEPVFKDLYHLEMYASGEEFIENMHKKPDLLILDHYLGGTEDKLSGLEVLQEIRKTDTDLPVILLSGCSEQEIIMEYNKLKVADFISKGNGFHTQLANSTAKLLNSP
jgi:DNA-binding NtrC family response regulator